MSEVDAFSLMAQFKEMQQEKKKLQNKLDHLRFRRKDLECKQNSGKSKLARTKEVDEKNRSLLQKNDSMSRTVHIAKMKVQESHFQVDKLQKVNDNYQATVKCMKESMKEEEDVKNEKLMVLQNEMDDLADQFRGAKINYEEDSLQNEIDNWKSTCSNRQQTIEMRKEEASSMSFLLGKMNLKHVHEEKPKKSTWDEVIDKENLLQEMFEEVAATIINKISEKTSSLQQVNFKLSNVQSEYVRRKEEFTK